MKKTLFFLFIVSILLTSNTKADSGWTLVTSSSSNDKYYVDLDRVRENSGYKFFWYLTDYGKVDTYGDRSNVTYSQAECGAFKYKWLDVKYYSSNMGKGQPTTHDDRESPWKYPKRKSVMEGVLKKVCAY